MRLVTNVRNILCETNVLLNDCDADASGCPWNIATVCTIGNVGGHNVVYTVMAKCENQNQTKIEERTSCGEFVAEHRSANAIAQKLLPSSSCRDEVTNPVVVGVIVSGRKAFAGDDRRMALRSTFSRTEMHVPTCIWVCVHPEYFYLGFGASIC